MRIRQAVPRFGGFEQRVAGFQGLVGGRVGGQKPVGQNHAFCQAHEPEDTDARQVFGIHLDSFKQRISVFEPALASLMQIGGERVQSRPLGRGCPGV